MKHTYLVLTLLTGSLVAAELPSNGNNTPGASPGPVPSGAVLLLSSSDPCQESDDRPDEKEDPKADEAIPVACDEPGASTLEETDPKSEAAAPARAKLTKKRLQELLQAGQDYRKNFTEAQKKAEEQEYVALQTKAEKTQKEMLKKGETLNAGDIAKAQFESTYAGLKKAALLPDKNGNITPLPPEVEELHAASAGEIQKALPNLMLMRAPVTPDNDTDAPGEAAPEKNNPAKK